MDLRRRKFLHLAAGVAALQTVSRLAHAQAYPTRPVRLIVGFPAGGSSDITARLVSQWLSDRLGQKFIVENRTGAGTNIAAESVVHAPPDGYSLLWITQTNAINATVYDNLNFNFIRDIQPVASILRVAAVVMINPSLPAKSLPEFIAYATANPGKINMSSPGIGSVNHAAGELFSMMTGVNFVHVPYRGMQYLTDLVGGQVQVTFNPLPSSLPFVKSGKLRALAVTAAKRQEVLPNIPTVGEFVSGYEATAWFGIGAPKNTPVEIVEKLNTEINAILGDPNKKARLTDLGGETFFGSPDAFGKVIASETEKWGKVVKFAGLKPE